MKDGFAAEGTCEQGPEEGQSGERDQRTARSARRTSSAELV